MYYVLYYTYILYVNIHTINIIYMQLTYVQCMLNIDYITLVKYRLHIYI